ncbi:hypothetical protein RRG08_023670 [Elysia crispata]|uniref:Uncharacterized protein n=1 Tax=Elysia crispata TaxID=231223 RepID=A0AAE0XTC9_9GAST|nr:hypothetical protein RRG08_023670 [Elysia crispata]
MVYSSSLKRPLGRDTLLYTSLGSTKICRFGSADPLHTPPKQRTKACEAKALNLIRLTLRKSPHLQGVSFRPPGLPVTAILGCLSYLLIGLLVIRDKGLTQGRAPGAQVARKVLSLARYIQSASRVKSLGMRRKRARSREENSRMVSRGPKSRHPADGSIVVHCASLAKLPKSGAGSTSSPNRRDNTVGLVHTSLFVFLSVYAFRRTDASISSADKSEATCRSQSGHRLDLGHSCGLTSKIRSRSNKPANGCSLSERLRRGQSMVADRTNQRESIV